MKKLWNKIKEKIQDYIKTNRALKRKLEKKNETIDIQAKDIDFLIGEKNEYRDKASKLEKERAEMKQQLRFLTKRENKLQQIEQLFEGKNVKLRDITKILEGDD